MDINIDGSHGEGGGQILRHAVALSILTGKSFRMNRIRAGRKKPGLKAQHLTVLRTVQAFSKCRYSDVQLGSDEVSFFPAPVHPNETKVDIGTAGSLTLLLQSLLPVTLFAPGPSKLTLIGGTDVSFSMTLEYLKHIVLPRIKSCARRLDISVVSRGFFPKGGGRIELEVEPRWSGPWDDLVSSARQEGQPLDLHSRGVLKSIRLYSVASKSLKVRNVAERMIEGARKILDGLGVGVRPTVEYALSRNPGCSLTAVADFDGGSCVGSDGLGEKGKSAEKVGEETAGRLAKEIHSGAPVDAHAADNLIPWLALLGGKIRCSSISGHTRTAVWLCEQFLGSVFQMEGNVVSLK